VTIHLLRPEVADAIAAGEVVERPASVVKELVENGLDAGARRVSIDIRGAGRNLIRVADDGSGVPAGELRLAFTRHATSKVESLTDLEAIASLGFRGEALASVAAVADVLCTSSGARLRVRAGRVLEEGAAASAPGTVVEVRELFANVPARLRFLKSDATETAACLRVASHYAQLYPEVRFEVRIDGRAALQAPGGGDRRRALAAVHGQAVAAEMLALDWAADSVRVEGLTSQPRLSRGSRDGILLAVNRRPVASRALGYALEECYLGALERGRHPLAVVAVSLDPAAVDVNVHPTKREVRFREEGAVFGAVQRAVRAALAGSGPYRLSLRVDAGAAPAPGAALEPRPDAPALPLAEPATALPSGGALRPLGQVQDGYLVAEGPEGVVLVDQHAAHERVLYNRFRERLRGAPGPSQPLLIPQTLQVDPSQLAAAAEHRPHLEALGFELEEFGPRSLRVLASPVETPPGRALAALEEMLAALAEGRDGGALEEAAVSLACHSAVRFGDPLEPAEQRQLLQELEAATEAVTCPHGRPTRLLLDWQELKRHFRRNY